jgi:hypothetical protein
LAIGYREGGIGTPAANWYRNGKGLSEDMTGGDLQTLLVIDHYEPMGRSFKEGR